MNDKTDTPQITVRNLKIAEFASQETLCFEATIYVDGKRFCTASNQGHGGDNEFHPLRPRGGFKSGSDAGNAGRELDAAIKAIGKLANPNAKDTWDETRVELVDAEPVKLDDWDRHMMEDGTVTTWQVFDHLVGHAITRAQYAKDLKRLLTRRAVFIDDDNRISNTKQVSAAAWDDDFLGRCRKAYPGETMLNDLPFEDALDRFIGAAS